MRFFPAYRDCEHSPHKVAHQILSGSHSRLFKRVLLFIFYLVLFQGFLYSEYKQLTILHTNDIHGHILPMKDIKTGEYSGGLAAIYGYIKNVEKQLRGIPLLVFDSGDFLEGSPEDKKTKGETMIRLLSRAGYDAVAIGNHDFAYSERRLSFLERIASFPFLSCNIFLRRFEVQPDYIKPYKDFDVRGLRIRVVGISHPGTAFMNDPANVKGIKFVNPEPILKDILKEKGKQFDICIVLSHLGSKGDIALANRFDNIDVILGGHDHKIFEEPLKVGRLPTLICQAGAYGQRIGRLDIQIDTDLNRIISYKYSLVELKPELYPPDKDILSEAESFRAKNYDTVIGKSDVHLWRKRGVEHPAGNFVADAIRQISGSDISIISSSTVRYGLPSGEITLRDMFYIFPFEDSIVSVQMDEDRLKQILEKSLDRADISLLISGISVRWDISKKRGHRVLNISLPELPEGKDLYRVALSNFFYRRLYRRSKPPPEVLIRDAIVEYVRVVIDHLYRRFKFSHRQFFISMTANIVADHLYRRSKPPPEILIRDAIVEYVKGVGKIQSVQTGRWDIVISKVNINNASIKKLMGLPGIGKTLAGRIIEYREKQGKFNRIEDITNVKGIGKIRFEKIQSQITVQ